MSYRKSMTASRQGRLAPWALLTAYAFLWTSLLGPNPAWAIAPDNLTIAPVANTDQFGWKLNPGTGDIGLGANQCAAASGGFVCEGTTADAIELYIAVADPTTPDKTVTFPNETGTVCTTGSVCSGYSAAGHDHAATYLDDDADETYGGVTPRTLTVDNSRIDLDDGGNGEGKIELPNSTSRPGTCEVGELYIDTDEDTDGSVFFCKATDTWKDIDDDGGGTSINAVIDATTEMKVPLSSAGTLYITPNGRVTTDEADCRVPMPGGTYNNLQVSASANQTASDLTVEVGEGPCSGALTYDGTTLKATVSATANTVTTDTGTLTVTGGTDCMCLKAVSAAGMLNPAYLGITFERLSNS